MANTPAAPASNRSWLACFDRSYAATAAYVRAVYSDASPLAWRAFKWSTAEVLFPSLLSGGSFDSVLKCLLRSETVYKKMMMGAVWVSYRSHQSTGHVPYPQYINQGGPRRPCQATRLGWTEVMHEPKRSSYRFYQQSWGDQLWMYVANGSGELPCGRLS